LPSHLTDFELEEPTAGSVTLRERFWSGADAIRTAAFTAEADRLKSAKIPLSYTIAQCHNFPRLFSTVRPHPAPSTQARAHTSQKISYCEILATTSSHANAWPATVYTSHLSQTRTSAQVAAVPQRRDRLRAHAQPRQHCRAILAQSRHMVPRLDPRSAHAERRIGHFERARAVMHLRKGTARRELCSSPISR